MNKQQKSRKVSNGFHKRIADIVGCSAQYVYQVLTGIRKGNRPIGRKIKAVADAIKQHDAQLSEQIK